MIERSIDSHTFERHVPHSKPPCLSSRLASLKIDFLDAIEDLEN